MNKKVKIILIMLCVISLFTTGFTNIDNKPKTVYRVYLKGESLGLIKSKNSLENYIDNQQEKIKKKYKVDKVYAPQDLVIEKETTYANDIKTTKEIYNEIKDKSSFTISGYLVKIKGIKEETNDQKTKKTKTKSIYVLDKEVFNNAIKKSVKAFIPSEKYNNFENDTQPEIKETGSIIENIYIKNKITIKKMNVPADKKIYLSEEELSKYLLFGTTKDQKTYKVKAGDTVADIAYANKMSTEEFLISNPDLGDENSLLSEGQEVKIGVVEPQFRVVEEDHVVIDEASNYLTETVSDSSKCNSVSQVTQKGSKGLNRVTQKIQKINGQIVNTVTVSTEVLKEATKEIVTKGTMSCGGWSNEAPRAGKGYFAWPAACGSVSSPFGYRWGAFHDGTDIAGCGYGSPIYAAADGVVVESASKAVNGSYITIKHPNGYYTMYAHLSARRVSSGQHVNKGQVIGAMGKTGAATGVHLHFAVWTGYPYRGGRAVNAMSFY